MAAAFPVVSASGKEAAKRRLKLRLEAMSATAPLYIIRLVAHLALKIASGPIGWIGVHVPSRAEAGSICGFEFRSGQPLGMV